MAQAEDTELRDLVVEALEKNGSLAKIRALLRANIFLVFEDDCENIKQNVNLDNILKLPEESRQGKEYPYEGHSSLLEKLKFVKQNNDKEPVLLTLVKNVLKQQMKLDQQNVKSSGSNHKEEQNNTYIVHEDSTSSISHSNSDNSSDEKNRLHLRLPLDNSDTDTSSDSARGKTSSEYIPNEHVLQPTQAPHKISYLQGQVSTGNGQQSNSSDHLAPDKSSNLSNSDSTSFIDIKPKSPPNKIMNSNPPKVEAKNIDVTRNQFKTDTQNSPKLTSTTASNNFLNEILNNDKQKSETSENSLTEYSLDFNSPASVKKDSVDIIKMSPESEHNKNNEYSHQKINTQDNSDQKSISSISTSDVADILSDISNPLQQKYSDRNISQNSKSKSISNYSKKSNNENCKFFDEDSGDFSDSPIPSLSNLSLDIHSD